MKRHFQLLLLPLAMACRGDSASEWPLWESFAAKFVDHQGRVIDFDSHQRTTSEGQAYASFFALVANDKTRFDSLLRWTQNNLASGDLKRHLPAWNWGRHESGDWKVLDSNSASDADLWLAYTLLQAAMHWKQPSYRQLAEALTKLISSKAVKQLPGLGPMLLPAPKGFQLDRATYQLNPSYLPLQVVLGLAESNPRGPWRRMALGIPAVVRGGAPRGFMLDWVAYNSKDGFQPKPSPAGEPAGSFDAIRVYLWAGMLDHSTAGRAELLEALGGMRAYLIEHRAIPDRTSGDGKVISTRAGVGFAAALIPFAIASGELELAGELKKRLAAEFNTAVGLYGPEIRYYDQCLALFSTAWVENRYSFDPRGNLSLKWSQP